MKLIMETWRKFVSEDLNYGEKVKIPKQASGAVPPKDRPAINIYPEPGSLYDTSTGAMNKVHASELLNILDQDGQKMKSSNDPYVDDWLEKTSQRFREAIAAFQEKGKEEADAIERSLNDQFEDAIGEIQAIIASRTEDTVDISDPDAGIDTIPGGLGGIDSTNTLDTRPAMQPTIDLKRKK